MIPISCRFPSIVSLFSASFGEEKLIERFAGKVEGVILISSRMPEERLQGLAEKIPIVLVNRDVSGIPRVLIDAGSSLKQAVRLLAHQGHQEIAYLSGPYVTWTNKQRRAVISEVTNDGVTARCHSD